MRIYRFPFEKVCKENARVILYGMGNVGKQYLSQCISADSITVLFAVDANSELAYVKVHDVSVYPVNRISNLKDEDFDYVIISMDHDENARFTKDILIGMGVAESKIIYSIHYYESTKNAFSQELYQWHNPSFSWFGEDLVVSGLFKCMGIVKPSYLDVGCNHPYQGNNTALLYLTGSSGINIDANPNCIELMKIERPDDINLCLGVIGGGTLDEREFYMLSDFDALNSFSKDYIEDYEKRHNLRDYDKVKKIKVPCMILSDIIQNYCKGKFPDYFDLDIEGLDDEVVASYDFTNNGPKIMCVESHSEMVCTQMLLQGYVRYFSTTHNVIFVRKELIHFVVKI